MHPPLAFLQKHIMTKQTLPTLIALVASFLLQGCASAPSRGSAPAHGEPLPPVAAEFRTVIRHDNRQETSQWRYWRSANRVQREDLQARTGEVWIRDGATLFHTLVFHEDRRGVEFEPADLQMTGETSSWEQQAQIVNPGLLKQLRLNAAGRKGGIAYEDYTGTINGVRWRVRMRTDFMLPLSIEQRRGKDVLRVELLAAHPLAQAPWSPPVADGYGMVDFADLGDHERDPFVLRLQAHMGIGHGHEH